MLKVDVLIFVKESKVKIIWGLIEINSVALNFGFKKIVLLVITNNNSVDASERFLANETE